MTGICTSVISWYLNLYSVSCVIAHGRTISETIERAKDIVKKLNEAQEDNIFELTSVADSFDYQLFICVYNLKQRTRRESFYNHGKEAMGKTVFNSDIILIYLFWKRF